MPILLLLLLLAIPGRGWAEEQPIIGMRFVPVRLGEAIDNRISPEFGLRVWSIDRDLYRGGPGALKVGDFIYKINGRWVSPPSLTEDLHSYRVGDEVALFIIRSRRRMVTRLSLAGRPLAEMDEDQPAMAEYMRIQTVRYHRVQALLAEMATK